MIWELRTQRLDVSSPVVMGIVNVTPDSFSDGGKYSGADDAVAQALKLAEQGAAILDIGGESTRPYSDPVAVDEELRRVIPVIERLTNETKTPISIDTSKAAVARAAIDAGAEIINDVTGLEGDPEMVGVARDSGVGVCAMHMQGTPQTMQDNPNYENVVEDIYRYLAARLEALRSHGINQDKICLDPGIGFGKTHEHNIELIRGCKRFLDLGQPILVGHSRKGFIGKLLHDKELDRDAGTLGLTLAMADMGIHILRVHEVEKTVQAMRVWQGVFRAEVD